MSHLFKLNYIKMYVGKYMSTSMHIFSLPAITVLKFAVTYSSVKKIAAIHNNRNVVGPQNVTFPKRNKLTQNVIIISTA